MAQKSGRPMASISTGPVPTDRLAVTLEGLVAAALVDTRNFTRGFSLELVLEGGTTITIVPGSVADLEAIRDLCRQRNAKTE